MHNTMNELITLREAAKRLGVHIATLRTWVREGRLPAYRLGARFTRISWPAVLAALEEGQRRTGQREQSWSPKTGKGQGQ